ncbi:putative adenylate cyclase regulatory protein [Eucalyptus grandis]|uniref:putative adenylate cyclase regulatory protein n=1 Tax=Eucalyptus grandis TaxID=71139 RepID=UPI0005254220|nr:putative adenylate cyclase regulatory protein [Eucalyptus grandis]
MGKLEKLEELYIGETAIGKIPQCISSLKMLKVLDAAGCESLFELSDSISHLVNLLTLDLRDCPKLCKLPESIGSLVKLQRLSFGPRDKRDWSQAYPKLNQPYEGICELPKSIGDLKNLKFLQICCCIELSNLPSTISKLGNLEELDASHCESLGGKIHIDGLSSLKILQLSSTGVSGFHGTFNKVSCLEELKLGDCQMLQSLPELPTSLTVLKVSGQHSTFPQLSHLIHLKKLTVKDCPLLKSMPELPSRLLKLSVSNCGELKELPSLSRLELLSKLYLNLCKELTEIRGVEGLKSLATLIVPECSKLSNLDGLEHLESLRLLHIWTSGPILKDDQVRGFEKLKNLESLVIVGCESLVRVDVSQLTHLEWLDFCGCCNLLEIKGLERLKNLTTLNLVGCPSIDTLPDLSCFHNLEFVFVDNRSNIPDFRGVRRAKYLGNGRYSR